MSSAGVVRRISILCAGCFPVCAATVAPKAIRAAAAAAPAPGASLPDLAGAALRVGGGLIIVLAMFLGGVWLARRWPALRKGGNSSQLKILEVKPIGARQSLLVVGYGPQRMLLGASPAGVAFLSHLPELAAAEADSTAAPPGFTEVLQRFLPVKF